MTLASLATTNVASIRARSSRAAASSCSSPAVSVLKPTIGRSGRRSRTASTSFGVGSRVSVRPSPEESFASLASTV
jgi:hypothetical protein